ncbi:hypothetical protein ES695_14935 [Candidatus Atribacteria bacterium 1244-E10-H5-B2]|nr:MAG: hypothetical protein ES695_14935 [Candidatus Atribacteria bacterium 1244-E10-H5-B2]
MAKFRSAGSHYGRTEQAKKIQRSNLIPGGNIGQRKKISEARINCFWECIAVEDLRWIFEWYVNDRFYKDIPEEELKGEEYLDNWWSGLDLDDKKFIYKNATRLMIPEERNHYFKEIKKCLKKKLENGL